MIFTGNAAELADLTRSHWGAEWWPKGLGHARNNTIAANRHEFYWEGVTWIPHHFAASIIFAAAWVAKCKGMELEETDPSQSEFSVGWWSDEEPPTILGRGPSPLHAVLAAVEACK